jgi:hypothetical protein
LIAQTNLKDFVKMTKDKFMSPLQSTPSPESTPKELLGIHKLPSLSPASLSDSISERQFSGKKTDNPMLLSGYGGLE